MNRRAAVSAVLVVLATLGLRPRQPRQDTRHLRHTIEVGGPLNTSVSCLRTGPASGARLILVHGTPGSATGWDAYLLDPPPGAEVVALDRPGFGLSGPPGAVTALDAQAAAVVALLPDDGRKAILVGHSLGGAVVAHVAASHPDRVSALVLLAASLDPGQERVHPLQRLAARWPIRSLLPRSLRNANLELIDFERELRALARLLAQVTAPTLIVHGTDDDLVPFANVAYMQRQLTGARMLSTRVMPAQDHFLPWNAQSGVRSALGWAMAPTQDPS